MEVPSGDLAVKKVSARPAIASELRKLKGKSYEKIH